MPYFINLPCSGNLPILLRKSVYSCFSGCLFIDFLRSLIILFQVLGVYCTALRINTNVTSGLTLTQELFISRKLGGNYKGRTVKGILDTLKQALDHAVNMQLISSNPVTGCKLPRHERSPDEDDGKVIPVELRGRIIEALECEPIMKPVIMMLMFTGIRSGDVYVKPGKIFYVNIL